MASHTDSDHDASGRKEFYYAVLNLPVSASGQEVRERYRALSVLYHPDKQQKAELRDTANKRFLEIQKAYEVLSDPFLRTVYDILGEEGLSISDWPPDISSKPESEIRDYILGVKQELKKIYDAEALDSESTLTMNMDATSLFDSKNSLVQRWSGVAAGRLALRQKIQKDLDKKTKITLVGIVTAPAKQGGRNILGTVAHQFSPRLSFKATAVLLQSQAVRLNSTYKDEANELSITVPIGSFVKEIWPPVIINASRRLFKDSFVRGHVTVVTGPYDPTLALGITSPPTITPGQTLPLAETHSVELKMDGLQSMIEANWGVMFVALSVSIKVGIQASLGGITYLLTGQWSGENAELSSSVGLTPSAVIFTMTGSYMGSRLNLPVVLSLDYNPKLALGMVVLPVTGYLLADYFVLRHRRRAARLRRIHAARKELQKQQGETESRETVALLQETAARRTEAERSQSGLVIQEAFYGPASDDAEVQSLRSDVTTALRALVSHSQLHIPGRRPKTHLHGFFDVLPGVPKVLTVSYTFRDRLHYAEILDDHPVTLPLEEHLIQ